MMRKFYLAFIWVITIGCIIYGCMNYLGRIPVFQGSQKKAAQVLSGDLKTIEMNGDAFDVTIKKGVENKVSYYDHKGLHITFQNGKLVVKGHVKKRFLLSHALALTITVKDDLDRILLDSQAGDIDINDVHVKTINMTSKAGDIDVNNCQADDLTINTKAGDIDIDNNHIQNIDVKSSAGDFDCDNTMFSSLKCELLAGDCTVNGAEDLSGYTYHLETKFGDVDVNGKSYQNKYISQGSSQSIDMKLKAGDIEINY